MTVAQPLVGETKTSSIAAKLAVQTLNALQMVRVVLTIGLVAAIIAIVVSIADENGSQANVALAAAEIGGRTQTRFIRVEREDEFRPEKKTQTNQKGERTQQVISHGNVHVDDKRARTEEKKFQLAKFKALKCDNQSKQS